MASRVVRTRGMEPPYAPDQLSALILHPIISAGFIALSALSLRPKSLGIVLAPFLVLNGVVVGLWIYIGWTDPAEDGGCPLRAKGAETPHYCSYCRKTVKGFDHHCSWLNTCISARNYAHFYLLGVSGSLLYLYMTTVGLLALFLVEHDDQRDAFGSVTAARVAWGVFIGVAGWTAVSFVALAGFHSYLLFVGLGTYDWVVLQNQKRQEKLAARRHGVVSNPGSQCCGRAKARPAVSTVQDDGRASFNGSQGRPSSATMAGAGAGAGLGTEAGARGSWGGVRMGMGVTPTRSRLSSSSSQPSQPSASKGGRVNKSSSRATRGVDAGNKGNGDGDPDAVARAEP